MRSSCAFLSLALAGTMLIARPSMAQNDNWQVLKALHPNQQIRVSLRAGGTHKGALQEVSDATLTVSDGQALKREDIQRVWVKRPGHRGKHALIGAGIGAGVGLGLGAGIDNSCSANSIICTGNRGKAIGTPLFALIGAGIGAALPTGGWEEVYRSR
jgi:hypothetical protein